MRYFSQVLIQKYSPEELELKKALAPESHLVFSWKQKKY